MTAQGLLAGMGVVVTRDESEDGPLSQLLQTAGARVVCWPSVRFGPPEYESALAQVMAGVEGFDWIVVTSPRAAQALSQRLRRPPERPRIAAVGGATAEALELCGLAVDLQPEEFRAGALVRAFARDDQHGKRFLYAASSIARDELPQALEDLGAEVVRVDLYRPLPALLDREVCLAQIRDGEVDVVTFTSPSAVHGLLAAFGEDEQELRSLVAVAIGATTGVALETAAWQPRAVARPSTLVGVVDAVMRCRTI